MGTSRGLWQVCREEGAAGGGWDWAPRAVTEWRAAALGGGGQGLCPRPGPGPHQATPHIMAILPPGWHDTGRAGGLVLNIGTITPKHSHRTVMPTHRPSERTTVPSTLQFTPLRVAHPQGHARVAMGLQPQCRVRSLHSRPRVRRTGLRGQCFGSRSVPWGGLGKAPGGSRTHGQVQPF